jgi:hypothetical protein
MILNKEYFNKPYYFYLTENKHNLVLYYNYSETLTESRKGDEIEKFDKKDKNKLVKKISEILKNKKIKNKKDLTDKVKSLKGEIDELVDTDGTFLNSKLPILNPKLSPKGTTDQEITQNRMTQNSLGKGYYGRIMWGESKDMDNDVVSEIDLSGTYGREETENLSGPETFKVYKDVLGMEPEEAAKRTKQQGKTPDKKTHKNRLKNVPKKIKNDPNFIDRMTLVEKEKIEETRKKNAIDMVEDIIVKNKLDDKDLSSKKDSQISKFLQKNLQSMKKIAKKEGLSINDLIKILKKGE